MCFALFTLKSYVCMYEITTAWIRCKQKWTLFTCGDKAGLFIRAAVWDKGQNNRT